MLDTLLIALVIIFGAFISLQQFSDPERVLGFWAFILFAFSVLLLLLRNGITPGKWCLGLRIVDAQTGEVPGFGKMFIREIIGRTLCSTLLNLGFLWAIFDKNAQGWHDKLAGTVVLRTKRSLLDQ